MTVTPVLDIEPYGWETPPPAGTLLFDVGANRLGLFQVRMAHNGRCWLRPEGGGTEWSADLRDLFPADQAERLSARIEAAGMRAKWEGLAR